MSKFKLGDKVVVRAFTHDDIVFHPSMRHLVGKVGIIKHHYSKVGSWGVLHDHENCAWAWPDEALTLVGTRHKFADVIIAWANGAKVQYRQKVDGVWHEWADTDYPAWDGFGYEVEYRVKPEPKPDVVQERLIKLGRLGEAHIVWPGQEESPHNVKLTFDGETGKLKAVELLAGGSVK
jgi:hypothetical protein